MSPQYAKDQPAGFSNHIKNIAVVGATGSVGQYIVDALLKGGKHNVTAITRAESKSKMPDGVKAAPVNYDDEQTLIDALTGHDALVITMGIRAGDAQTKLVNAAAKAGVPWIMPNEYTADVEGQVEMAKESGVGDIVWPAEEQIEKLGVSCWVGLVCSFWYEYSLAVSADAYGFDIKNKKATFFDDGETKINASTWKQCGRAVAAVFSLPILPQDENDEGPYLSMWKNKHVFVSSFLVSQRDMLDSLLRVTGDKESDWTIEHEPAEARWKKAHDAMQAGDFSGYVPRMYTRVFYKDGCGDFSHKLDNARLGLLEENQDAATKRAVDMVNSGYNYFARG